MHEEPFSSLTSFENQTKIWWSHDFRTSRDHLENFYDSRHIVRTCNIWPDSSANLVVSEPNPQAMAEVLPGRLVWRSLLLLPWQRAILTNYCFQPLNRHRRSLSSTLLCVPRVSGCPSVHRARSRNFLLTLD